MESTTSQTPPSRIVLDEAYRQPVFSALKQQTVLTVLALLTLDMGQMAKSFGCCLIGFWLGFAIIAWRRPFAPTELDLKLIRWGSLPLAIVAFVAASMFV